MASTPAPCRAAHYGRSSLEVVSILREFGFHVYKQEVSHIKLRRLSSEGRTQTLSVPRHRQLVIKTLFNI